MSKVARPRPNGQPGGRRPARPTHGKCRLALTINGTVYNVRPTPTDAFAALKAFRLKKPDGTAYDVAQTLHGAECDCPDFVFHRDGIDPAGCKHIKALAACGLIDPPPAIRSAASEWPAWTDEDRWTVTPDETDEAPGFDPFDPDYLAEMRAEGGDA